MSRPDRLDVRVVYEWLTTFADTWEVEAIRMHCVDILLKRRLSELGGSD